MCCLLYFFESVNVDICYVNECGIMVIGICDYGDEGVIEYVVSELVCCFYGFGQKLWEGIFREIIGLKVGIVGLGKFGGMIVDVMKFFGVDIVYYVCSEKKEVGVKGYCFMFLNEFLIWSEVVCCCLNKNMVLLYEVEFKVFGNRKILFNIGLLFVWDEFLFI